MNYKIIAPLIFIIGLLVLYLVFGVGQDEHKPQDFGGTTTDFSFQK